MLPRLVTSTLTALLVYAGLLAPEADASASAVQSYGYSTYGSIANQAGVAPITFLGVNSQTLTTPGTFSLGQFDALNILPASATLTYNNTPFTINLNVGNGTGFTTAYQVSGTLNGWITGSGTSDMVASVTSITGGPPIGTSAPTSPPFPASDIKINVSQAINAPNALTGSDGYTTLYAQISPSLLDPVPAPEPASIAVFGAGVIAWAIRRRMTRSKRPVRD